jgi:hypothetical protein
MKKFILNSVALVFLMMALACNSGGYKIGKVVIIATASPETLKACETIRTTAGRTVLRKLSNKAMKPGTSEHDRQAHSLALLVALASNKDRAQGLTLIMELQLVAKEEATSGLAAQLKDPRLYKAATRALIAIGAHETLAQAFLMAPADKELIFTKAMSAISSADPKVLKKLTALTTSKNKEVPMAAYIALASSGHPSSFKTLEAGLKSHKGYKLGKLYTSLYVYLRRMAKEDKSQALKHLDSIIDQAKQLKTKEGQSFLVAGLSALYDIKGDEAFTDLSPYLKDSNLKIRVGVTRFIKAKISKNLQNKL